LLYAVKRLLLLAAAVLALNFAFSHATRKHWHWHWWCADASEQFEGSVCASAAANRGVLLPGDTLLAWAAYLAVLLWRGPLPCQSQQNTVHPPCVALGLLSVVKQAVRCVSTAGVCRRWRATGCAGSSLATSAHPATAGHAPSGTCQLWSSTHTEAAWGCVQ
jgi:hypothetical protein